MTKDKTLRLALEAFNDLAAWNDGEIGSHMDEPYSAEIARKAITAIKAALEAKDAPSMKVEGPMHVVCKCDKCKAQPEQEPVAWMSPHIKDRDGDWVYDFSMYRDDYYMFPVYTTPPQRTWVGLTDDDRVLIKHDADFNQFMTAGEYADRVQALTEARLKDVNT
jgi:hypothetical protein